MKTKSLLFSALLMTSAIFAQIPTNGLIGYYPFSGNANDYSTGSNNGTVNGATLTADRFGSPNSAYYFNGTSSFIDFTKAPFTADVNFSISVWIKRDTLSIGHHFPAVGIGFNGLAGNTHELNVGIISTNGDEDLTINVPGYYALRADTNVTDHQWMHLVVTKQASGLIASTVNFYLNGVKVYKTLVTGSSTNIFPLINKMVIGKQQGTGGLSFAHGAIDDIRIYDRAIDAKEVDILYHEGLCYQFITVTDTLLIHSTITGFNPITYQNTIKIYPNPSSDHLTIDYGDYSTMSGYTVKIINSLGQTVFTSLINLQQSTIDLNTWNGKGVYFVQIIDDKSHMTDIKKIVIQ